MRAYIFQDYFVYQAILDLDDTPPKSYIDYKLSESQSKTDKDIEMAVTTET